VLDIVKGLLPVIIGRRFGLPDAGLALTAMVAVLGHDYSIFLRFQGGKGVASTLGAGLGLTAFASVLGMVVWVGVIVATGYSSLASLVALGVLPIFVALTGGSPIFVAATSALFLLALWKHRENINRLWNGTERKFRSLKPANGA
jgi:glycerol-3-phosphate acyltransferase PlsY